MKSWMTKSGQKVYKVLGKRSNCFLISYHSRHLLVDTGRKNRWENLTEKLEKLGVNPDSLTALILTHCHFDHAENAAAIKEKYKTSIIIHRNEADYLQRGENSVIQGSTLLTRWMTDVARMQIHSCLRFKPADYDILVDERYDLNHLGFHGYLLHTPGHSPGSISVVLDDEIALVGDTMFGVFKGSVFPPFANDPGTMVRSWEKLLNTGCSIYLPAHGLARSKEILQQQYDKYKRE